MKQPLIALLSFVVFVSLLQAQSPPNYYLQRRVGDTGTMTTQKVTGAASKIWITGTDGVLLPVSLGTGLSVSGGALNVSSSGGTWGSITGTLSSQTDLQTALDGKAGASHTQAWSTITGTPTTRDGYGITDAQPLDTDLTAIAGVTTTSYGRDLLALANQAALQTAVGITPSVDATPNTVVLRDNNGSALVNLSLSVNNGANEESVLRPAVLEFYNAARTGKVSLAPPATINALDDYVVRLPSATGTLLTDASALDPWQLIQRSATDGQALVWSAANSRWQPGSGAADGRFNPRGVWSNGTAYAADDAVMVSGAGAFFCIQAHTSTAANDEPLSGTNWTNYWTMFADTSAFAVPLSVAEGGTGQTTASGAINALLPAQTGHGGQYLTTNGTAASWSAVSAGVALGDSPTWTGAHTFSKNGALSTPTLSLTGTPITGGTSTTTKPLALIETSGATSTNWSTSGTMLGINAPSGFAGQVFEVQHNGSKFLSVEKFASTYGSLVLYDPGAGPGRLYNAYGWLTINGCKALSVDSTQSSGQPVYSGKNSNGSVIYFEFAHTGAARELQLGASSATPSGYLLRGQSGTGTNIAGGDLTIAGGAGTGNASGGTLKLATYTAGASGTAEGTKTTRVEIRSNGAILLPGLPTTDPGVSGQIWSDSGTLKISP